MNLRHRRRIRPDGRGGFDLRIPAHERELLSSLPKQLDGLLAGAATLGGETPHSLRRLLPTAYPRDEKAEAAYVQLVRGDLLEHHRQALGLLADTSGASHLSGEQLEGWLGALNDLRLVLGTALEVREDQEELDTEDPRYPQWMCYGYLSFLQNEVVDALSGLLPPPQAGADDAAPEDPWGEPLGGLRWDGTPLPEVP